MNFHEVRFPTTISRGGQGGPERRTDVVVLGSGFEERNSRWSDGRRNFNAGYGIKSLDDLHTVIEFFEERRGRLYGFRWRDYADWKSGPPQQQPGLGDQRIGTGDGIATVYQLLKVYGSVHAPWSRIISKPVQGSVMIAVAGSEKIETVDYTIDYATGIVTFLPGKEPLAGTSVTAGFEFDVPVRFDSDKLEVSLSGFSHGAIPSIPIIEVRV